MKDNERADVATSRKKALQLAIDQITKDFGQGAIMKLGDDKSALKVDAVSTGFIALDKAIGVGGLPRGRVIEVFGPESGGKTTLCLHALASVQKAGGTAAFIDAEHALDPAYARKIGVDVESLLVSQPGSGEEALEIADSLIRSGAVDILVLDSVAALVPKAEIEGDMGDSHMGLQARLMSQALRKLTANVSRSRTICVFINQIRMKIGVMFGNPEVTPGGRALKFYSSLRLDVRGGETLKQGNDVVGKKVTIKIVKNKVAPPFRSVQFDMIYGAGISREAALIDLALEHRVLESKGTWIRWDDESIGQGREKAREWFIANPNRFSALEDRVRGLQ